MNSMKFFHCNWTTECLFHLFKLRKIITAIEKLWKSSSVGLDQGRGEWMILKWMLGNYVVRMWNEFSSRICFCGDSDESLDFINVAE